MISATRRWIRRNRTPIAVGVGVVGAGYLATQYVLGKIKDARQRMSSDRIAKENLRRRFEQNQEDCTFTVLALLPTATANLLDAMNTEGITLEIQQMKGANANTKSNNPRNNPPAAAAAAAAGSESSSSTPTPPAPSIADTTMTEEEGKSTVSFQSDGGVHVSQMAVPSASAAGGEGTAQDGGIQTAQQKPRKTKRQLWDDLTISSITRVFTLIYTLALLTLLTRIQLNLLGRRSYLSSVVSLATGAAQSTINLENNDDDPNPDQAAAYYGSDFETNRKYLTFSWWLLNRGWVDVMERVEQAVRDVFGHLSPRDLLSFDTFSQLTLEVRKKVERSEGGGGKSSSAPWLSFLLPPSTLEDYVLRESGVLGDSAAAATMMTPTTATAPENPFGGGGGSVSGSATVVSSTTAPQSPTPASLRRLLDETADLVESPTFTHVLTQLLDAGFSHLLHHKVLPGAFEGTASTAAPSTLGTPSLSVSITAPSVISVSEAAAATTAATAAGGGGSSSSTDKSVVMLPKILSVLTRQAHAVGSGGGAVAQNEYLREMELVPDLEAFAAVVYSSNWENEIQRQEEGEGQASGSGSGSFVSVGGPEDLRQSQASWGAASTAIGGGGGDESLVLVDASSSQQQQQTQSPFESAWEKATGRR